MSIFLVLVLLYIARLVHTVAHNTKCHAENEAKQLGMILTELRKAKARD